MLIYKLFFYSLPFENLLKNKFLNFHFLHFFRPHTTFEVEHYNELLRAYIANNRTVTASSFLNQMGDVKPNLSTFELILRTLGEVK